MAEKNYGVTLDERRALQEANSPSVTNEFMTKTAVTADIAGQGQPSRSLRTTATRRRLSTSWQTPE